jgi:hypothetical protein
VHVVALLLVVHPLPAETLNVCGVAPLTDTVTDCVDDDTVLGRRTMLDDDALADGIIKVIPTLRFPEAGVDPVPPVEELLRSDEAPPPPHAGSAKRATNKKASERRIDISPDEQTFDVRWGDYWAASSRADEPLRSVFHKRTSRPLRSNETRSAIARIIVMP